MRKDVRAFDESVPKSYNTRVQRSRMRTVELRRSSFQE
jgi:hypothetical protein